MKVFTKTIAGILLLFFLGTMFLSLYHLALGMDMTGGMSDCPFMSHTEVLCPMDVAEHLSAWKMTFIAVVPSLLAVLACAIVFGALLPNVFLYRRNGSTVDIAYKQLIQKRYSFTYRGLQELFSDGILHPKLF